MDYIFENDNIKTEEKIICNKNNPKQQPKNEINKKIEETEVTSINQLSTVKLKKGDIKENNTNFEFEKEKIKENLKNFPILDKLCFVDKPNSSTTNNKVNLNFEEKEKENNKNNKILYFEENKNNGNFPIEKNNRENYLYTENFEKIQNENSLKNCEQEDQIKFKSNNLSDTQKNLNDFDDLNLEDEVMIISNIEDKMNSDFKRSQEGNIFLKIALQNNRNFPIDEFDFNLFNEIYQNILIVKINSKNFAKNIDQIEDVYVIIIDILNDISKKNGYDRIKEEIVNENNLKILIGGGDGTVLEIVDELNNLKINIENCIFGHLPLGTGNDLSNSMGFKSIFFI